MIYLVLNNEEKGYIMKRKIPKITNSEKQILEVLWDEEKPLTSSEIVGVSDDRTWKASSVHLLLNSLLNKDLVEVAGFKKTTKNYARTFQPTMTREEYSINQLRQEQTGTGGTIAHDSPSSSQRAATETWAVRPSESVTVKVSTPDSN